MGYEFFILAKVLDNRKLFYPLALASHITTALSMIIDYLANKVSFKTNRRNILLLAGLCLFFFLIVYSAEYLLSFTDRIDLKIERYSELVLDTRYSGLADLFIIFTLLFICSIYNRTSLIVIARDTAFILLLCMALYLSIQISLGFIRSLKLIIVALAFSTHLLTPRKKIPDFIIILPGVLYSLNFLRQVYQDPGFLPYGNSLY